MKVLADNGYKSIAFPLISSGIFGGRLDNLAGESAKQCYRAYNKFAADYPDIDIEVNLCAFSDKEMTLAQESIE